MTPLVGLVHPDACGNCGEQKAGGWTKWTPIIDFENLRAGIEQPLCARCHSQLRQTHAGPCPCAPTSAGPFHIIHSNVDGAGSLEHSFATKNDAMAYADWQQRLSDATGNPWLYRYHVYASGRGQVYETKVDPRVLGRPLPTQGRALG